MAVISDLFGSSSSSGGGGVVLDPNAGYEEYVVLDADIDYSDYPNKYPDVRVLASQSYGLTGELGFGETGYGGGSLVEVSRYQVEFDSSSKILNIALEKSLSGPFTVNKIDVDEFILSSTVNDLEFIVFLKN